MTKITSKFLQALYKAPLPWWVLTWVLEQRGRHENVKLFWSGLEYVKLNPASL